MVTSLLKRIFIRPGLGAISAPPILGQNTLVLSDGYTASTAYLLQPYLKERGCAVTIFDSRQPVSIQSISDRFSAVVVSRYLHPHWTRNLELFRAAGGPIAYFMDDDLMDPAILADLPSAYAKKIRTQAIRQRTKLETLCTEFWVSSTYLAVKYPEWRPILLTPMATAENLLPVSAVTVCYHGSSSHLAEIAWLAPIIAAVQKNKPDMRFEAFGDHTVNKMYRDIPGAAILHPMNWPNYLAYSSSTQRDIALAPLLPHPFNSGRGPTKFFDFARMGAVGIYTNIEPYRGFIRDGVDGLLLENEPDLWLRSIIKLAGDEPLRRRMAEAARQRALDMALKASGSLDNPC